MPTIRLQASSQDVGYDDRGAGPVLLLVHGFPLDRRMWAGVADHFQDRCRVLAVDLPGFGKSSPQPMWSIDGASDLLVEFLDHLGISDRVIVGGLSMGGYVALAFARRHPQRLRGLVLADTKAPADDEAGKKARETMIRVATEKGTGEVIEAMMPKMLGETTRASRPDVIAAVRQMARDQTGEAAAAALAALRDRPDSTEGLSHISVSTLVIVGSEDLITPPDLSKAIHAAIPAATLAEIPQAGHVSNLENPAAFHKALASFLDALPADGGMAKTV